MKRMILYALAVCLTFTFSSCYKTYTCQDAYGNAVGEVKAVSKVKAQDRCEKNTNGKGSVK